MSEVATFVRLLFVSHNVITFIIGFFVVGYSIFRLLYPSLMHTLLSMASGMNHTIIRLFVNLIFGAGVFVLLTSFCGYVGGLEHSVKLLILYIILRFVLLLFLLGGALDVFFFHDKLRLLLRLFMFKTVARDFSLDTGDYVSNTWNTMQDNMQCCGSNNYSDFLISGWQQRVYKDYNVSGAAYVPISCCKVFVLNKIWYPVVNDNASCVLPNVTEANMTLYGVAGNATHVDIHKVGCYESVLKWFVTNYEIMILMLLVCVISEVTAIVLAIFLIKHRKISCHANRVCGSRRCERKTSLANVLCGCPKAQERLYCMYHQRRLKTRLLFMVYLTILTVLAVIFLIVAFNYMTEAPTTKYVTLVVYKFDNPYKSYFVSLTTIVGVILFCLSVLGWGILLVDRNCYYYMYAIALIIGFCITVGAGVFVFSFKVAVNNEMATNMPKYVFKNVTAIDTDKYTTLLFYAQFKLKCCGHTNYTDYINSTWHEETGQIAKPENVIVPWTCCKWPKAFVNLTQGMNNDTCQSSEPQKNNMTLSMIHEAGCFDKLSSFINTHMWGKIVLIFITCCLLVGGAVLALNLAKVTSNLNGVLEEYC